MGGATGVWAAFLLMLMVGSSLSAPPSPTGAKRSDENIQFGNQQNKPVSVLDEDALPGAFPSSETTESGDPDKPTVTVDPEEEEEEAHKVDEDGEVQQNHSELPSAASSSPEEQHQQQQQHHHLLHMQPVVSQHLDSVHHQPPRHREEMVRDLPPVALASRWRPPSEFYSQHWGLPLSPMYGGDDGLFPTRRRRRSADHGSTTPADPRKKLQVSLHALRTGHRHKRDVHDIRRIRRDLGNSIDLDKLRREVDVVELLAMLTKPPPPPHRNPGFATVTYAPLAPAPPRFAPQPKLFPDYEEEEEEEEEDEGGVGELLRQSSRPTRPQPDNVMSYPMSNRLMRRSGGVGGMGYGLYAMPGFKRSAFRANTPPPPPVRTLNPGDVYSLAAMLGAELDPATHRLRRAAM